MRHTVEFKKSMSTFSLMMTGITSIIGSGWLLATQKIATMSGPAGIFAWAVGALVAILIALFCIEIGTANPSAGGVGSYSNITHGRFSGFITQWVNWLSVLAVPAVEAQAIVQYLSESAVFCHGWYNMQNHILSSSGIFVALVFMLLFMAVNYWGLGLFTRFNNSLTVIKIVIPLLTIAFLFSTGFHTSNLGTSMAGFAPYGWRAVGGSVISCGVIMSFNGFQLPLNFSEEIKSPKTQLPIAIIGSIIFTFILYVLLQVVFIGKVSPDKLIHGWHGVNYRSPYVDLLLAANLQVMAWSVMSTSAIAPAACGSTFVASASRIIFNLARAKMLPDVLGKLDPIYRTPRAAIVVNIILGSAFLFIYQGWTQLVAVISVLHVFSYLSMPVVAMVYRKQIAANPATKQSDHFRLPGAPLFAVVVLFVLALLLFFSGWPHIARMGILLVPGLCFFFYYEYKTHKTTHMYQLIKSGSWLLYFILGISTIGYLGNNKTTGHNIIDLSTSLILLAALSITSFIYGIRSATDNPALL